MASTARVAVLSEWHDAIVAAFCDEKLSLLETRARLVAAGCPSFRPQRLRDYLRSVGLYEMRGRGRQLPKAGTCKTCGQPFAKGSHHALYCKTCVPDLAARNRMSLYGLTQPQFDELLRGQGNRCACCERDLSSEELRKIHIDHCHTTGKIRAIVCANCNYMLGLLESPWWQERFVKGRAYLARHGVRS